MSTVQQVVLGIGVSVGLLVLWFAIREISVRVSARAFREQGPDYQRYVRRRFRRAFNDGASMIATPLRRRR